MGVYLGGPTTIDDYSALQGPCPDGFHVPLKSEWEAINNAGISLGAWNSSNGNGTKTYLKLPFSGARSRSTSNPDAGGTSGGYWTSNASSNTQQAYCFLNSSTEANASGGQWKSVGRCIRAMRNNSIAPDSTWTVLKQGTGTAGIYHNSSLGLISLSSDGTTRYTIADKNLGATTVYNDGNTLSEANCGKFYQRGNNYGFPYSGSVTTSSSQVNAGSYGPGNYYSSSTFILRSSSPEGWDSSNNANLRGGVTGVQPKTVYPELKNAYIGEYVDTLFDFGDWTNSQWTALSTGGGTINKSSSSIAFTTGKTYSDFYLSQYPINGTKDFLLELRANIPNTTVGTHDMSLISLVQGEYKIQFQTAWQSSYVYKMWCVAGGGYVANGGNNPGIADYFIKKEGNKLTMGRNGTTVYTNNNYTFNSVYYLYEQVYNTTLTIYTAKLTYL